MNSSKSQQPGVPVRIKALELPNRVGVESARQADINLLKLAPKDFLDTTHFDTVRFPPPLWAREVFNEVADDGSLAYTPYQGNTEVLENLSESISKFMDVHVGIDNIILTPGTQAGLFTTLASIVEQGDKVALMSPDYLFSARILSFLGSNIDYVPIQDSSTTPKPDFNALEDSFKNGAKVFVFSNPNNPIGYVYSEKQLNIIADLAIKYNVIVVVDSLYSRLMHDQKTYTHLSGIPGMKERVFTLLGPSKTESLSGYRLGIVVGPESLMPRLENALSVIALRAPAYSQHLLKHWLSKDQEWVDGLIESFTNLREMTIPSFKRLPWLKLAPQFGTAYAWPDVTALKLSDEMVAQHLMKDAGVLVSPGYQFGVQEQGHFRVCYARDEKEWGTALDRMVNVLNNLGIQQGLGNSL